MSSGFRKFLPVFGALLIAGSITYYPETYMDELTGHASAFYGLTAIYWAPVALLVGVASGCFFCIRVVAAQIQRSDNGRGLWALVN